MTERDQQIDLAFHRVELATAQLKVSAQRLRRWIIVLFVSLVLALIAGIGTTYNTVHDERARARDRCELETDRAAEFSAGFSAGITAWSDSVIDKLPVANANTPEIRRITRMAAADAKAALDAQLTKDLC